MQPCISLLVLLYYTPIGTGAGTPVLCCYHGRPLLKIPNHSSYIAAPIGDISSCFADPQYWHEFQSNPAVVDYSFDVSARPQGKADQIRLCNLVNYKLYRLQ